MLSLEELSAIAAEMPSGHRYFVDGAQLRSLWPDPVWQKPSDVDDHLTVEQRVAKWAAARHVQVWEQHDPQGVMMQKRTLTGRIPNDPEMQYNTPKTSRILHDPEMNDFSPQISNAKVMIIRADSDYAALECRVLAAMADDGVSCVYVDFESYQSDRFDFLGRGSLQITGDHHFTALKKSVPAFELLDGPPVKQNGRSAAYLKHDRTKRHRR